MLLCVVRLFHPTIIIYDDLYEDIKNHEENLLLRQEKKKKIKKTN